MHSIVNFIVALIIGSSYVVSIHSFKPANLRGKDRNHELVIRHRFKNVGILCGCWIIMVPIVQYVNDPDVGLGDYYRQLARRLLPITTMTSWYDLGFSIGLMMILYCGPIFNYWCNNPHRDVWQDVHDNFTNKWGVRDHLFAPITEEIIYRAILYSILSLNFDDRTIILYGPLLFGIAHIHHGYELIMVHHLDPTSVMINVLVQTTYTTLFGMLASYIFVVFQNIWCSIILHIICNVMGFPTIIDGTPGIKFIYYSLLPLGVYGFVCMLYSLA